MSSKLCDKLMRAARGTKTGAIIAAMFGQTIGCPCFHGSAVLTSDGFIMADFTDRDGQSHMGAFVGDVADLRVNLQRLAEHVALTARERATLERKAQAWLATRYSEPGKLLP